MLVQTTLYNRLSVIKTFFLAASETSIREIFPRQVYRDEHDDFWVDEDFLNTLPDESVIGKSSLLFENV